MDADWTFSSRSWLWEEDVTFKNSCSGSDWSREENKAFENGLASYYNDTDQWDKIALAIPGKTVEDLKLHYKALNDDVVAIESGKVPLPHYSSKVSVRRKQKKSSEAGVQRGVPWTEEEHRRFLYGLQRFGRGDWKSISRYSVRTKSNSQVASHAQKYFKRLKATEGKRPSINDIRSVHPESLLAMEKATTSCMPRHQKEKSTNTRNQQLLPRNPKKASTNERNRPVYSKEVSTNSGNQLLSVILKKTSTTGNQPLPGYSMKASTSAGNQLLPENPKETSTNAGSKLFKEYSNEVSTNTANQLFLEYAKEALNNVGKQLLPPIPFADVSVHEFSGHSIAGADTSAAAVPACSMFTPSFAARSIQEPGVSVGMPAYHSPVALMRDGGVPPASSFDISSSSSYSEIMDLDMFVFPHFLD